MTSNNSLWLQSSRPGVNTVFAPRCHSAAAPAGRFLMSGMAARQPVDLDHLARYTGGEETINAEVLALFTRQCAQSLIRLHTLIEARDARTWRDVLHTLKGSALGVGAFSLAEALASAEAINPELAPLEAAAALERLESGSNMVGTFVTAYLRR